MNYVTAQEYITLADELTQDTNSPIRVRAAASRAYYGAYHAAMAFHDSLPSKGAVISLNVGVHEQLIQSLENPTLPHGDALFTRSKSLGIMLRIVRKCRINADYEIGMNFQIEEVQTSVAFAKKIIAKSIIV